MRILKNVLVCNQSASTSFVTEAISLNYSELEGFVLVVLQTPSVGAEASVSLEASIDDINWVTIEGSTKSLSGTSSFLVEYDRPYFTTVRMRYTWTSGEANVCSRMLIMGRHT